MSLRIIKEGKAWSHTNRARDRDNRPRANKVTRLTKLVSGLICVIQSSKKRSGSIKGFEISLLLFVS